MAGSSADIKTLLRVRCLEAQRPYGMFMRPALEVNALYCRIQRASSLATQQSMALASPGIRQADRTGPGPDVTPRYLDLQLDAE
jgi:hypothetical protein